MAEQNLARYIGGHEEGQSMNDVKLIKVLAQGGFCKVLLAEQNSPGRSQYQEALYTIKVMKKWKILLRSYFDCVKTEKDIRTTTQRYTYVISFYCCFQTEVICRYLKYIL